MTPDPRIEAEFAGFSAHLALEQGDHFAHDYLRAKAAALRLRSAPDLDLGATLAWPQIQGF